MREKCKRFTSHTKSFLFFPPLPLPFFFLLPSPPSFTLSYASLLPFTPCPTGRFSSVFVLSRALRVGGRITTPEQSIPICALFPLFPTRVLYSPGPGTPTTGAISRSSLRRVAGAPKVADAARRFFACEVSVIQYLGPLNSINEGGGGGESKRIGGYHLHPIQYTTD